MARNSGRHPRLRWMHCTLVLSALAVGSCGGDDSHEQATATGGGPTTPRTGKPKPPPNFTGGSAGTGGTMVETGGFAGTSSGGAKVGGTGGILTDGGGPAGGGASGGKASGGASKGGTGGHTGGGTGGRSSGGDWSGGMPSSGGTGGSAPSGSGSSGGTGGTTSGGTSGSGGGPTGGTGGATPEDLVKLTKGVERAGLSCFRIEAGWADLYFDPKGGGFVSLVDPEGNDWISWNTAAEGRGAFRGVPNLGACCHPGIEDKASVTRVLEDRLDRVVLHSTPASGVAGSWRVTWVILPDRAELVVDQPPGPYHVLYEGTPGGQLGPEDWWGRSDGVDELLATASFEGDLLPKSGAEWAYFEDTTLRRALVFVNAEDDAVVDNYWTYGSSHMTVFGFGRQCRHGCPGIVVGGQRYVLTLTENTSPAQVSKLVQQLVQQSVQ